MYQNGVKCESFTIIFIDFLLVYENKYYIQAYLDNSARKIMDNQMKDDNFDDNFVESGKD